MMCFTHVLCTYTVTHFKLMRVTQYYCLAGEALEREEGTVTNDQAHILTAERLLTATSCTRGLIFDGMKHGTGKQFEEQSRYTKGIWKRNRLRREQRDCPTLNWRRISNNRCAHCRETQKSYRLSPADWNLPESYWVWKETWQWCIWKEFSLFIFFCKI